MNKIKLIIYLCLFITGGFFVSAITSCGKSAASAAGLNIQYEIINLSPDLLPIDLYMHYNLVNSSPFIYANSPAYFYLPTLDTPFQIRSHRFNTSALYTRTDVFQSGAKYSLFFTGSVIDNSIKQIYTVDTATAPALGRGKVRFINASPSATGGLDVYANGTIAFSKAAYLSVSNFIELPVGNYDFQLNPSGSNTVLKDVTPVTIQDGRLYTLYAYGYTTRIDSAAFNGAYITNK